MRLWISFPGGAFRMWLWISFPGGGISHAAVDFLSRWGISHAAVDFLSRGSILHAVFPFQGEHFACGFSLPGGAFRMRQVRGGEAFIVAKAIVPSSRSSPPGHAAVLCCGMCYFSDGAMDSTVLDIAGCADININNGYAFLIQLNITEHESHIREQARYASRFSRPPSSIGSALNSRYSRIHRPINNVSHTTTYAPKSVPGKGEREGEKRASQL